MKASEAKRRGYPRFMDRILEMTGTTWDDIEREKKEEQKAFSRWCTEHNARMRGYTAFREMFGDNSEGSLDNG